jgi:DNA replication and repair protein RecF
VRIGWLQILEFRNHRTLSWSPSPKLNVLTGGNAQGKTNLLEAVGFLVTGRSFRTNRLAEIPSWNAERATIAGELIRAEGTRLMRRMIERLGGGTWRASGEDCPWARAVAFGWADLEILNGPPAARRRFLDGFAARLYASHRGTLARYREIVGRRNALLQQRGSLARLAPWDEQLAVIALEVVDRRRRAVAALQTEIARIYPALAGAWAKAEIRYRASLGEATEPGAVLAALERARPTDLRRGQTLVGPHRDDLAIELGGVDARTFGSRGQQRLLALALRLAEVLPIAESTGTAPVLLLDDALSELDPEARASVLREIEPAEQVFLTAPEPLPGDRGARWLVREGEVVAA